MWERVKKTIPVYQEIDWQKYMWEFTTLNFSWTSDSIQNNINLVFLHNASNIAMNRDIRFSGAMLQKFKPGLDSYQSANQKDHSAETAPLKVHNNIGKQSMAAHVLLYLSAHAIKALRDSSGIKEKALF